jgi:hypothetical protein
VETQSPKIVFVLGAAANKELDSNGMMPVGSELAERIQRQLSSELNNNSRWPEGPISKTISSTGGLNDTHIQAMRRIEQGITHCESIDQFIDEWSDFRELTATAKFAIAYEILRSEAQTQPTAAMADATSATIAMRGIRDSWLGLIFRFANKGVRRRDTKKCLSNISFITFNYDRCLEAALYLFFRDGQNTSKEDAAIYASQVPVFHVYGFLGKLPEFDIQGIRLGSTDYWNVSSGSKQIKTFTEECESTHRSALQQTIQRADRIVFLGFGFHRPNVELIQPISLMGKEVFATVYGMRDREIAEVNRHLKELDANCHLMSSGCSDLVKQHREDIFE